VRETLPQSARVRGRKNFDRVFRARCRASDRWMTLYGIRNQIGVSRLGNAVGKRLGNAVHRNRIKRLIREAFRRVRHQLPHGIDWVVVPKPGHEPTVTQLQRSICTLAARLEKKMPPHQSS